MSVSAVNPNLSLATDANNASPASRAHDHDHDHAHGPLIARRASLGVRIVTLLGVVLPFLGLAAAIFGVWGWGFSWLHLFLLAGMYLLTAVGITVGYHRLFTHKSFETTRPMKFIFAVLGSMAVEGPVLKWVAMHRRHHQHSDGAEDPHSPNHHGEGLRGLLAKTGAAPLIGLGVLLAVGGGAAWAARRRAAAGPAGD